MSIPMNVGAGKVGDPGFGRNSLGAGGINYRICRLGYFTKWTVGDVRFIGKFGAGDFRLRDGACVPAVRAGAIHRPAHRRGT
jgi:hypothetical protein